VSCWSFDTTYCTNSLQNRGINTSSKLDIIDQLIHLELDTLTLKDINIYGEDIVRKINEFTASTKTKKSIFTTFVTTFGVNQNKYSKQLIQNELTMDDLFLDL